MAIEKLPEVWENVVVRVYPMAKVTAHGFLRTCWLASVSVGAGELSHLDVFSPREMEIIIPEL